VDHLRPVIDKQGLPSGYLSDMWNQVPACSTCNCSKGNSSWEEFMARTTGKAPLARGVHPTTHAWRVGRLRTFVRAGEEFLKRWHVQQYTEAIMDIRRRLETCLRAHEQDILRIQALVRATGTHDNIYANEGTQGKGHGKTQGQQRGKGGKRSVKAASPANPSASASRSKRRTTEKQAEPRKRPRTCAA
jgi:hypothetical protein